MKRKGWIILAVAAVLVIGTYSWLKSSYNDMVLRREAATAQLGNVENQYQRRMDLIPNLVNTVKGYARHEEKIFTEVADARSRLLSAQGPAAKAEAGAQLNSVLGRLLAVAENYPQLKASDNFVRLQDELAGTENRISVARTRYNQTVRDFNAAIRKFPGSLFAPGLDFKAAEYFQPPEGAAAVAKPPAVSF